MNRTTIWTTAPQRQSLQALAGSTGLSVAELVRRAIDDYVKRQADCAVTRGNTK